MKDSLGDRMKGYYESRTKYKLPRRTYTIIRLDGKAFHTYTKKLNKPFDAMLMEDMAWTTKHLCENIQGCKMGYTQSDEISLLLTDFDKLNTDAWFDNNIQKMASVASSICTGYFNRRREEDDFGRMQPLAYFDARVFTIPTAVEVENYFIWRQKDATRNSVSMVAQSKFSHNQLHHKSVENMKQMLQLVDDPWYKYPDDCKYGNWIKRGLKGFHIDFATDFVEERERLTAEIPRLEDMEN